MITEYAIIIQARMGSTRRPGKISYEILGKSLLYHQISRLKEETSIDIIVATTDKLEDDWTESLCKEMNVACFRGSENDVMYRYLMAAKYFNVQNIIRVGGDDPLIDPECIKKLIEEQKRSNIDFIYASHRDGWIYGTAAELISREALEKAYKTVYSDADKEHVVTFVRKSNLFCKKIVSPDEEALVRPDIFLSVDYQEDLDLVEQILIKFKNEKKLYSFTQKDVINLYDSGMLKINNKHLHVSFEKE